jgi:hypothetical protein
MVIKFAPKKLGLPIRIALCDSSYGDGPFVSPEAVDLKNAVSRQRRLPFGYGTRFEIIAMCSRALGTVASGPFNFRMDARVAGATALCNGWTS